MQRIIAKIALVVTAAAVVFSLAAPSTPAMAGDDTGLSCRQLWYERNKIYADNGFCFNTARARRQFGAGCFPPYGRLTGYAKSRVSRIKQLERINGC